METASLVGERRLDGCTIVILGAGSVGPGWGNGRACAIRASEDGAHVVIVDKDASALQETETKLEELGSSYIKYVADLTIESEVEQLFIHLGRRRDLPPVRGLVCAVGGSVKGGITDLSLEEWHLSLSRNLDTAFIGIKYATDLMKRGKGGSVVFLGSTSGLRYTGAFQAGYAAAKAGLAHLARVAAVELAPVGIRANTVTLGQLHTPMVEARLADQRAGGDVTKILTQRSARTPLNITGDGRDTAAAACYLLSNDARFVTGAELVVDGGMSVRCD